MYREYKKAIDPSKADISEFHMSLRTNSPLRARTQASGASNSNINTSKLSPGRRTFQNKGSLKAGLTPKKSEKDVELNDFMVLHELR